MGKNLVIVESPAKAKTIAKFLGKDFTVLSSVGHIRDIPTKKAKDGRPPVDIENNFAVTYEIDPEKKKIIAELRKAVKESDETWLATDEDREGEAIAWHLAEVLKLNPTTTKRIVFHEITKPAIEGALQKPRTIDLNLVNAQQARRVLDRLVGFELSPVVQRKVPGGRSAGRVQSPAVRLIVEREREIDAFTPEVSFKITAQFSLKDEGTLNAELKQRFKTEEEAKTFLESLKAATFTISDITQTPGTRNPAAPFTTSTLQQEAAGRLGFSVKATMSAAQKLYQDGKITYMRTDSFNLSPIALGAMGEFIKGTYGNKYYQTRTFKTKSASAQEAHEAIRPTDVTLERASSDPYEQRLYELIRKRTLATQMAPAKMERTTATITISTAKEVFEAKGEVIVFDGFLKVYDYSKKEDSILPPLESGDVLGLQQALAQQLFSRPPARYSEGSLVKKLEELGIGRPSTYATIISTIQDRGYVQKGEGEGQEREAIQLLLKDNGIARTIAKEKTGSDKGKLVPTASGMVVNDFLGDHFGQVVDYDFTADVEEKFDHIAHGKQEWHDMLRAFYNPFHKLIEGAADITRAEAAKAREIGTDPKTGKPIMARFGRFGPMVQLGETESEEKPKFASIPAGLKIETITLEQALKLFELPRSLGQNEQGEEILVTTGRFGPYAKIGARNVSIKGHDPYSVSKEVVLELAAEAAQKEAERTIQDFPKEKIQVLNGRYGPYITDGKTNAKIPKDRDPATLTVEECKELIKNAPPKKGRGRFTKKTAKKK
ncbi:MAG TPA: type I DNA topoisomerase [Candidatus Saccharimonadales bacterium]|nr:type I DNA topoisomerase [Candidatus Saccharimonadales bacterium]